MILYIHRASILGVLLLSTLATQGCLGIVWLGTVGIDVTRTSDIEFQSFENSWELAPQERQRLGLVKSIAVMPFVGDPAMAQRWTAVFREMTDLRVVSLSDVTRYEVTGHERTGLAQRMSAKAQVDCLLFGRVAGEEPQKSFGGLKESSTLRLYLHLMSAEGTLMWKTELPFMMVKGAKDLDEEMVTQALLTHVRAQANEIGLAELGVRNHRTAS